MSLQDGYSVLGRTGTSIWDDTTGAFVTAPAASDTVTLYSSIIYPQPSTLALRAANFQAAGHGQRIKALYFSIFCTNASAANGFQVDVSNDGGVTWRNVFQVLIAATTFTPLRVKVSAPEVRVRFVNSAAVQTVFEWSLLQDQREGGNWTNGAIT